MRKDEYKLVQRIIGGDKEKFRFIIKNYRRLVFHIIFRMVSPKTEREELGQEIFIKVYDNLGSFKGKSSLATWISVIAHNTCKNYLKKKKIELYEDQFQSNPDEEDNPFEKIPTNDKLHNISIENNEIHELLGKEINNLPIIYREIISLYYLEEFSYKEISTIVGLPEGTIKSYMFRARAIMKDNLLMKYQPEDL